MNELQDLSSSLKPVLEYETQRGNAIVRVDRPAGSNCPLAIIFASPLDISGYHHQFGTPDDVRVWENKDAHYPLEAGYLCERTRHVIAGPIPK